MKKILYIDDNIQAGKLVQLFLERAGYDIRFCVDAEKARELIKLESMDLIITDIGLPGENGVDFYKWVKAQPENKDLPVLLVSAHAFGYDGKLAEFREIFIEKPIFFPGLVDRIKKLLGDEE